MFFCHRRKGIGELQSQSATYALRFPLHLISSLRSTEAKRGSRNPSFASEGFLLADHNPVARF